MMNRYIYSIISRFRQFIEIISINDGDPLSLEGIYEDGVKYYATSDDRIADITDPLVIPWQIGFGNSNGELELDIKEMTIAMTSPAENTYYEKGATITFGFTVSGIQNVKVYINGVYEETISVTEGANTYDYVTSVSGELNFGIFANDIGDVNDGLVVQVAYISGLATDPSSPTEGVSFTLSGLSENLDGEELTLEKSTNNTDWTSLGTATPSSDAWSKVDCQVATAGTWYFRARYGTSVVSDSFEVVILSSGLKVLGMMENGLLVEIQNQKTII